MLCDEFQAFQVHCRQGGYVKIGVRDVDALLRTQLGAVRRRMRDPDLDLVRLHGRNLPADFAVIQPDQVSRFHAIEELGKRHADSGGADNLVTLVHLSGPAGFERARQDQRIAGLEHQTLGLRRQDPDSCAPGSTVYSRPEHGAGHEVGGSSALSPAVFAGVLGNFHRSFRTPGIRQSNLVPRHESGQPALRHG
jgi:hypothetical protein